MMFPALTFINDESRSCSPSFARLRIGPDFTSQFFCVVYAKSYPCPRVNRRTANVPCMKVSFVSGHVLTNTKYLHASHTGACCDCKRPFDYFFFLHFIGSTISLPAPERSGGLSLLSLFFLLLKCFDDST